MLIWPQSASIRGWMSPDPPTGDHLWRPVSSSTHLQTNDGYLLSIPLPPGTFGSPYLKAPSLKSCILSRPRTAICYVSHSLLEFPVERHTFPVKIWLLRPPPSRNSVPVTILGVSMDFFPDHTLIFLDLTQKRGSAVKYFVMELVLGSLGCQIWHTNSKFYFQVTHS